MSEMNSFQDAFYIIAKELGFDYAQPLSPREVFEQQMLPRIRELVATQPATGEPVAWMIDWPDEPDLGHYFSESPDELTGSRSRPLFTSVPPAAAHGDDAVRKDAERYRWVRAQPGFANALGYDYPEAVDRVVDAAIRAAAMRAQGDEKETV